MSFSVLEKRFVNILNHSVCCILKSEAEKTEIKILLFGYFLTSLIICYQLFLGNILYFKAKQLSLWCSGFWTEFIAVGPECRFTWVWDFLLAQPVLKSYIGSTGCFLVFSSEGTHGPLLWSLGAYFKKWSESQAPPSVLLILSSGGGFFRQMGVQSCIQH